MKWLFLGRQFRSYSQKELVLLVGWQALIALLSFIVCVGEVATSVGVLANKPVGFVGSFFVAFVALVVAGVFSVGAWQSISQPSNAVGYPIVGSILALVGAGTMLLIMGAHLLLTLPPIESPDYAGWHPADDFTFLLVIALLAAPFSLLYLWEKRKMQEF